MKRIAILFLAIVFSLTLFGCTQSNTPSEETSLPIQTIDPCEITYAKPVIYLYPDAETEVSVNLNFNGRITSSYPVYRNGWRVLAHPDGTLIDPETGREYYCLFWEGDGENSYDLTTGFVVPGSETAAFLENTLAQMGLSPREANEFLIYWLPQMETNSYNLISFQNEAYAEKVEFSIQPTPDSVLRVFMVWKELDEPIAIAPQTFNTFERDGFTVVEWGGACIG